MPQAEPQVERSFRFEVLVESAPNTLSAVWIKAFLEAIVMRSELLRLGANNLHQPVGPEQLAGLDVPIPDPIARCLDG